ncbi:acetylornithine and succinylornithine aminotransferase [Fomitiporia mediterranea MF3/22]|uniref:acetylornithine and succinylornithine aminotransferase n=1 Tax=Fomitiporia mediterranea (strain MF3/22) TaxID=694068 RepID=UPI0004409564|nr:acetylornithine and succinylornithine aminotransferase [Fomitiporia mediterranea MF3/22]EJD01027.1 acetylornithine and succinylornithine aminotransferase [Fomitiporia mediterranea MF3/22]
MASAFTLATKKPLAANNLRTRLASRKVWTRLASSKTSPSTAYTAVTHAESPESLPESVSQDVSRAQHVLLGVYARPPLILARGSGMNVWDTQGRKYLDFTAGVAVNALGHADPEFVKAMATQAATISHSSNVFYNPWATELAELLIRLTQREGGLGFAPNPGLNSNSGSSSQSGAKVFFANSGTESNEGAFKIVRKVGKERWAAKHARQWSDPSCNKFRIACFEHSFHGRSLGSLSATNNPKYQKPFAPLVPGFDVGKVNDVDSLKGLVTEETCAVIVEPIQGEGGIFVVEESWLRALRKRCDEVGAVLIFDEIQCGLYRTGKIWAHSSLPIDCHPDIVTMAKPLANGFPIGAIMMRDEIAECMTPGTHGTTFGGSPLACSLGHHVLSRLSAPSFTASINDVSAHFRSRLSSFPQWFPEIISNEGIRGRGLMLGLPFTQHSREHNKGPGELARMSRERGLLVLTAGSDAVRLVPSLTVKKEEVDLAVDVMESVLVELQKR